MIKPTVGRVVLFTPAPNDSDLSAYHGPRAAIICEVWSDTCVNLAVFSGSGQVFGRTSVLLHQEGNAKPDGYFAEWMPYQIGQAAKAA